MEVLYPRCAGLDVHKKVVVACRVVPGADGALERTVRSFGTMPADLEELAEWLAEGAVTHVAMESTGVYWHPIWTALEPDFTLLLANARAIKAVPGRKTDVKDAEWIAELLRHGLISASFVPDLEARQLRTLTRYRRSLIQMRAMETQRLDKVLESANIKLSSVTSKIMTVSTRLMLDELLAGKTDPKALAQLAKGRLRDKIPQLERALAGRFGEHERCVVGMILRHRDDLDELIDELSARIHSMLTGVREDIERLQTIPGVGLRVAEELVAEIGTDMTRFPTADHLASWAKLCPGSCESAGVQHSGRTGKGNKWLRSNLVEAGKGAAKAKGTHLQDFYRRHAARRGANRATVATANKILHAGYYVLRDKVAYREPDLDSAQRRKREAAERGMIRDLERRGYTVTAASAKAS